MSTSGCTKAASIGTAEVRKNILVPQPTQPWRRNHKMGGGNSFSRCRRPSSKQGNTVLNPKRKIGELRRIAEGNASVYGVLVFKTRLWGSRGHGPKPAEACCPTAMAWQGVRRPSPYTASACCPLHLRWTVDVGPKAVEAELYHPGTLRPSP